MNQNAKHSETLGGLLATPLILCMLASACTDDTDYRSDGFVIDTAYDLTAPGAPENDASDAAADIRDALEPSDIVDRDASLHPGDIFHDTDARVSDTDAHSDGSIPADLECIPDDRVYFYDIYPGRRKFHVHRHPDYPGPCVVESRSGDGTLIERVRRIYAGQNCLVEWSQLADNGPWDGFPARCTHAYNDAGKPSRTTCDHNGDGNFGLQYEFKYDAEGRLVEKTDGIVRTEYGYDSNDRFSKIVTRHGSSGRLAGTTRLEYSGRDRPSLILRRDADQNGELSERREVRREYDYSAAGRLRKFRLWGHGDTQPQFIAEFDYSDDGRLQVYRFFTQEQGADRKLYSTMTAHFGPAGRNLTKIVVHDGNLAAEVTATVSFDYSCWQDR